MLERMNEFVIFLSLLFRFLWQNAQGLLAGFVGCLFLHLNMNIFVFYRNHFKYLICYRNYYIEILWRRPKSKVLRSSNSMIMKSAGLSEEVYPYSIQVDLAKLKSPRTKRMESLLHWNYSKREKSSKLSKLIMFIMRTSSILRYLIPSLSTLKDLLKIPDIFILSSNSLMEDNSSLISDQFNHSLLINAGTISFI